MAVLLLFICFIISIIIAKLSYDKNWEFLFPVFTILTVVTFFLFMGFGIGTLISISNTSDFIGSKIMIANGVPESELSQSIDNYNIWLYRAKAKREIYKSFSTYPKIVEELTPILK